MITVRLKPGREKSVRRGHPWIFSGAVAKLSGVEGTDNPGQTVRVEDSFGQFLAWGAISPTSKILVRLWSWNESEEIGADFLKSRLAAALNLRKRYIQTEKVNAYRLVHAESDGIPGLIADKYGNTLVLQFLTNGAEYWRDLLVDQLGELTGCGQIFERSDTDIRKLEGLEARKGVLRGEELDDPVKIREGELHFWVDIISGQKTGFYLDQRENRILIRNLARGRQVLDCFAFSGGFTVAALTGGAERVTAVDTSSEAIELGRENVALNQMPGEKVEWIKADVFNLLREFRDRGREFDMLILDPPKFAPTSAHAKRAARGYKDINLLACKLLKPGGNLVTFSCSGGIGEELFQKILAGAALDADVNAMVIKKLGPGPDHPIALNFPEGAYLKGLVLEIRK